jgi:acetyl-CoA carboxylase biotin carboxylase subunit
LKKILVANRGEIAVRIIRTCRDMGLASAAVYSDCDRNALHVRLADEAYPIGPDQASESYLRIDKLIDAARTAGADAVHPGYGFLAENPEFAESCGKAGLVFIGPSPDAMATMGSKTGARQIAARAGVPVVPGTDEAFGPDADAARLREAAANIGYPLLVKAVAGGGGKGMRVVRGEAELAGAVQLARSEARSAFGDAAVYFERLLEKPRHIEVQLLGDRHGALTSFVERECSIQRRHQKLVEETPSPSVSASLRAELAKSAEAIGRAVGYTSAGTIEFLLDGSGRYYFLEMNTRLQVEHPVTEAVTGIDFVRAQIEIAQGAGLAEVNPGREPDRGFTGHAIECRIYAEDPEQGFLPSPGLITHLRAASGPGIRDEAGAAEGWVVPTSYDPLISKVVAWAPDRAGAIARMVRALGEYDVRGIKTTVGFCRWLLGTAAFRAGDFDTTTVDRRVDEFQQASGARDAEVEEIAAIAAALHAQRAAAKPSRPQRAARASDDLNANDDLNNDSLWGKQARLENLR